jgi:hypothetical protein
MTQHAQITSGDTKYSIPASRQIYVLGGGRLYVTLETEQLYLKTNKQTNKNKQKHGNSCMGYCFVNKNINTKILHSNRNKRTSKPLCKTFGHRKFTIIPGDAEIHQCVVEIFTVCDRKT